MKRVEQHVIEKTHPQFRAIDQMALASTHLWNLANYQVRQSFIFAHTYLDTMAIFHRIKHTDAYQALPAKTANQVLVQVHKAGHYVVEVIYQSKEKQAEGLEPDLYVALDPGVNILAALTSNKPGFVPRLVSGDR